MAEIRRGLEENLNVSIYAKPKYTRYQMSEIRRGLERNIDVTIYVKSEYDEYQMKEIRRGLEEKDYWKATEGNAKRALCGLLMFAQLRPDGVWRVC